MYYRLGSKEKNNKIITSKGSQLEGKFEFGGVGDKYTSNDIL